jgi:hypothetical protein
LVRSSFDRTHKLTGDASFSSGLETFYKTAKIQSLMIATESYKNGLSVEAGRYTFSVSLPFVYRNFVVLPNPWVFTCESGMFLVI